jgi:predicted nucleic acid-binding protein
MATYYLDSSALVKRYVAEVGSAWLQTIVAPAAGHLLLTSRITTVEVAGALARRRREASLSPAEYADAVRAFRYDILAQYKLTEVDARVSDLAGELEGLIADNPNSHP